MTRATRSSSRRLEVGLCSIAVPVRDRQGRTLAALNVGMPFGRGRPRARPEGDPPRPARGRAGHRERHRGGRARPRELSHETRLHLRRRPHPLRPLRGGARSRADRRPRHGPDRRPDRAPPGRRLGRARRGDPRLRQPGGRGQPQRRPHGRAPVGPPRLRARGHGEPPVRLGPRGRRPGRARDPPRRGRPRPGRRSREHDPLAVRRRQGRRALRPGPEARGHDARAGAS